jgi:hypothetical protein
MRIAWIGGVESGTASLVRRAESAGHAIEVHTGDVRGRGAETLARVIERAEIVVIVIGVNSHGGALLAKQHARRCGLPSIIIGRPSVSALARVIRDLPRAAPAA